NLPAIFSIWVVAALLMAGTRESATLNAILVLIKIAALALFIAVALPVFNADHFHPFMPYGFPRSGPPGSEVGVMAAAAIIFFAFYGFDAIASAAEEAKNPSRDLATGSIGSMAVCDLSHMVVTAVVTSVFAGLIPLASIAALANAGTLAAFVAVCSAMLVLRRRAPDAERKFRAPAAGFVGAIGIIGCLYLFISLPNRTQLFFL